MTGQHRGRHRDRERTRLLWMVGLAAAVVVLIVVLGQAGLLRA